MLATSHYLNVLFAWFLFCSLKPSVRIEFDLQKLNGNASKECSVKKTIKMGTVHLLTQHTLYFGVNAWRILHVKMEDTVICFDCINALLLHLFTDYTPGWKYAVTAFLGMGREMKSKDTITTLLNEEKKRHEQWEGWEQESIRINKNWCGE